MKVMGFAKWAVLICLLSLIIPVMAQDNILEVKCMGPNGQSISGAKVWAIPLAAQSKFKESKSDKGVATFKKLDDGVYRILARQQGFAPALAEYFALKGGSKQTVELHFEAGDAQAKLYFEDNAKNQAAYKLLDEGVQALQAGKFADGEKSIRESLKIYPSNPDGNYNLAIALIQQKKFDETVAPLQKTVDVCKALQTLPLKDAPAGTENPYVQRLKSAQEILDKIPSFKLRSEGEQLAKEKKFDEAIAKYSEVLKIDPNDADIYYNISLAQANARKIDEALASADKAMQIRPQEKDYQELKKKLLEIKESEKLNQASGLLKEGDKLFNEAKDYAAAIKKYETALPLLPAKNQPVVFMQIGRAYAQLKQSERAVEYLQKAIDLAPEVADYRKGLAQFYLNEKRYDEALNVYSDPRATGNLPPDQALYNLGLQLLKQNNDSVAELALERSLKINPDNADALYEYGMLLYFAKKDKQAKDAFERYLQIGKNPAYLENVKASLVVVKKRTLE